MNNFIYSENSFDKNCLKKNETLFTLGNGYLGFRGNFEEGVKSSKFLPKFPIEGTYINGFYESEKIMYGESAYAFPDKGQTLLNVINAKGIKISVGGEEVNLFENNVKAYKRELDLKTGLLKRSFTVELSSGKQVEATFERLVSFEEKSLAAIRLTLLPKNFSGEVKLTSFIDGDVSNLTAEDDPRIGSGLKGRILTPIDKNAENSKLFFSSQTHNTKLIVNCCCEHKVVTDCEYRVENSVSELRSEATYTFHLNEGNPITFVKYISYTDNRFMENQDSLKHCYSAVETGMQKGFDALIEEQRAYLDVFWHNSMVTIEGDEKLDLAMKLNMFHLLQSTGTDGRTNIAAKGLTGEGYEGHYFWDTEIYILPFFLHTMPEIGRKLLEYRYSILDKARKRAREMSHKTGALFPWRTIAGEECSAYFPAGTAQYHICADIAFAIRRYYGATGDTAFMDEMGTEILIETARLWNDLGTYIDEKDGKFCINCVTGPNEYTAIVNNNFYTNFMAKENLLFACECVEDIKKRNNERFVSLSRKIDLKENEMLEWRKAADNMYLPYSKELGINLQDDSFLDKKPWDFENTPKENYPLLIHYHPLVIYRHRVCKQADTVLAEFLCSSSFTKEQKKRDYEFYEPLTTHDSSLSAAIFSIVACEIGKTEDAFKHFSHTALTDFEDIHGNTCDGIHCASMAGAWLCIVSGFGGLRTDGEIPVFNTMLPKELTGYSFRFRYKNSLLEVRVNSGSSEISLIEGDEITVMFNGKKESIHAI